MKLFIKKHFKKTILLLLSLFALLFIFRLMFGYQTVPEDQVTNEQHFILDQMSSPPSLLSRRNYASKKYKQFNGQIPVNADQKYEKIADIHSFTTKFEAEEKLIRGQIKDHDGLIQFENKSGNQGYRKLNLTIGIPPENFDSVYDNLVKIGKIQSKQITKTDKTNEYKELNAQKASLEKIRASLIDLKSKGGKIEEFMQLENRILEIEEQLQRLGVSLGSFDDENEFCTVKVLLTEGKVTTISILQRIKVALEWTTKTYLMLMIGLSFAMLCAYLLLLVVQKIRTTI